MQVAIYNENCVRLYKINLIYYTGIIRYDE